MMGLVDLIAYAREKDYELVEVYTNGTHIYDELLSCFVKYDVAVAVSFYADDPAIHDSITKKRGSHTATVRTIKRMNEAGLKLRTSIIVMDQNQDRVHATQEFLYSLGVTRLRADRVRGIGRGESLISDMIMSSIFLSHIKIFALSMQTEAKLIISGKFNERMNNKRIMRRMSISQHQTQIVINTRHDRFIGFWKLSPQSCNNSFPF